jgi:glyoxylase-like metal-dependent hydrolase (beta-lactamase superfamily II)
MKQLADGVWHLNAFLFPNGVNAYLVGDVLVDAGTRRSGKGILRDLEGHTVTAHALTHAHADHQGASHEVCTKLGIPYWVPEKDVDVAEDPELLFKYQPDSFMARFFIRTMSGPAHKVDRALTDGDEVAGFKVILSPGHSAGHVVYWRESDGVLILGDVLNNMDILTAIPGLRLPKNFVTPDPDTNRRSAKALAALEPKLVLFGHGAPLRDTRKFVAFLNGLPDA